MRAPNECRFSIPAAGALLLAFAVGVAVDAQAARGGGVAGHQGGARATARTSVNRPATSPAHNRQAGGQTPRHDINRGGGTNNNANINHNRNVNRDINRNVNVDVDVHDDHHDHWDDWDDHPFATAAAVTAGVAVTSAVIGSIVTSLQPNCVTTVINGIAYQQCGNTWYQPQYAGTNLQYIVVNPPR
ncbi:MAG TPA: hypothetical protein VF513_17290 [Stenotrophomonas sp.]